MANKNKALSKSLYPSKTYINFINQDKEKANWSKAGIVFCILLVLGLFVYLGFVIPNSVLNQAQEEYENMVTELYVLQSSNSDYSDVLSEYSISLNRFMTDEELLCVNNASLINIVFDCKIPGVEIVSIDVEGNDLYVVIKTSSLGFISSYLDNLTSDSKVSSVNVDTVTENEVDNDYYATYHLVCEQED